MIISSDFLGKPLTDAVDGTVGDVVWHYGYTLGE